MSDMQTGWEPPAALIGANSHIGRVALYVASQIYIRPSCSQLDLQIPSQVLSHGVIS